MAKEMLILTVGHVAVPTAVELAHHTHKELTKKYKDVVQLPVHSQKDVVATFARVLPFDLIMLALDLQDRLDGESPLVGETFMIEAQDLKEQSAFHLQQMVEDKDLFLQVVDCFWQESLQQKQKMPLESIHKALREGIADPANNITEAAMLLPILHQIAQKALPQKHSLVLRYEWGRAPRMRRSRQKTVLAKKKELSSPNIPTLVTEGHGWWQAQKRPLLIALLFALVFSAMGIANGFWPLEDATPQQDAWSLLRLFGLSALGVMTPFWLMQGWLWQKEAALGAGGGTAVWLGFGSYRFRLFSYQLPTTQGLAPTAIMWICVSFGFLLILWCIPLYSLYPALTYWLFPAWLTSLSLAVSWQSP